ncbi:protein kinase [Alkaliphilus pronyensis]|uniref:non-specific serine/threonine protein kinase n=1 Tax=Alkaliphilus pronyensis TaxID=1482732 RepID=A0A6I0F7B1_9FIRM|nr:serine/threonine-protein kinase [Alkaliphilus pronyensis]KAB3534067.1 protein kinase [Alkaliphilus pronyensis]
MERDNILAKMETELITIKNKSLGVPNNIKGNILKDLYMVEGVLGRGGMGTVYLCRNTKLDNLWAVKFIPKKFYEYNSLITEAGILKQLNHIHLPKIVDIFSDENGTYIVETYIEGTNLEKAMEEKGPFDENTVVEWGKQLADVLKYLHSIKPYPIIYRDMKPSNVMITPENKAVLIDFGISIELKGEVDNSNIPLTLKFAAPEQLKGYADQRTDIYNLGKMLYYLMTKSFTFSRTYNKSISRAMASVIEKCINENPQNRYINAEELRYDLELISIAKNKNKKINTGTTHQLPSDYKKIIGIFSPLPLGKTTIACNLASSFSKHGLSVSLIDTDHIKKDIQYFFDIDFTNNMGKLKNLNKKLKENNEIENIEDYGISISNNLKIYTDHRDSCYSFNYKMFDRIIKQSNSNIIIVDVSNCLEMDVINGILSSCNERLLVIDKYLPNLFSLPNKLTHIENYNIKHCCLLINKEIEKSKPAVGDIIDLLNSIEVFASNKLVLEFKSVFYLPNKYKEAVSRLYEGPQTLFGKDHEFDEAINKIVYSLYSFNNSNKKSKIMSFIKSFCLKVK